MADENPTHEVRAVQLRFGVEFDNYLFDAVGACLMGLRYDIAQEETLPDRELAAREEAAYDRLVTGLRIGYITPDAEVIEVAETLAHTVDEGNEYVQTLFEHRALCALVARLTECRSGR